MSGEEDFPKCATAQSRNNIKAGEIDFAIVSDFIKLVCELLLFRGIGLFAAGLIFGVLRGLVRGRFALWPLVVLSAVASDMLGGYVFSAL